MPSSFWKGRTYGFLVTLVTLSGAGALQLMPAVLGVCFPSGRLLTRTGVLAGMGAGLLTLYATLVLVPHPLEMHGGIWSVAVNFLVAYAVAAFTRPLSAATVRRIHGEMEAFVYGEGVRVASRRLRR